ncbi:hypothetical protein [Mesorhizobium sp. M0814]|uniref:hypothetical protein n=1 Tax=unclassified Mesorhizobium TaxID=325217 RepID=UPI00333B9656
MKFALSALLIVLTLPQAAEAKTKIPGTKVAETKVARTEKARPPLDNKPTGGITASPGAAARPPVKGEYNPVYPPAIYFNY